MPSPREPGQHFLLSKRARDLPLAKILPLSERQAFQWFQTARWPETEGRVPWCPHCGAEGGYTIAPKPGLSRLPNRFRCKQRECRRDFSVTSGTILSNRKLSFQTMLAAIALSAQCVKSKAALQMAREMGVQSTWRSVRTCAGRRYRR